MYTKGYVHKYGGTSVITAEQDNILLKRTIDTCLNINDSGYTILVTSGMGKINNSEDGRKFTDLMIDITNGIRADYNWTIVKKRALSKITEHQIPKTRFLNQFESIEKILRSKQTINEHQKANFIAFPELIQAEILYQVAKQKYQDKKWILIKSPFGLVGQENYRRINVPIDHYKSLENIHSINRKTELSGKIAIVPGFIGTKTESNLEKLVTLERGSSDATATYWAAALGLDEVVIYSDKPGILPIHPDIVSGLDPLNELTYLEAHLYAGWGAGIIQQIAIKPVREENIPLIIKSSIQPDLPGTRIGGKPYINNYGVKAIAYVPGRIAVIVRNISDRPGSGSSVEKIFGQLGINVEYLADGTDQRAHLIDQSSNKIGPLYEKLSQSGHRFSTKGPYTRIALVGAGMDLAERLTGEAHATELLTNTLRRTRIPTRYRTLFCGDSSHSIFIESRYGERLVKELAKDLGMINGNIKE